MVSSADCAALFYAQLSNAAKHTVVASRATVLGPIRRRYVWKGPQPPWIFFLDFLAQCAEMNSASPLNPSPMPPATRGRGWCIEGKNARINIVRLRVNESHQGWILRSIQGREVTLLKGRKSDVLALVPPGGSSEPASTQASLNPPRRLKR